MATAMPMESRGLLRNILTFSRFLRSEGARVSTKQVLTALEGVTNTSLGSRTDFYWTLRCTMVSKSDEIEIFDRCFRVFWEGGGGNLEDFMGRVGMGPSSSGEADVICDGERKIGRLLEEEQGDMEEKRGRDRRTVEYSPVEILGNKDFDLFDDEEVVQLQRAIDELSRKLSTRLSHRKRRRTSGALVDLRRSFRHIVKQGGEPLRLIMSERRPKKIKLVLLCDVSGSMDSYSRFFTRFMYAMQNRRISVETFVFSTRLTRITSLLLNRSVDDAFARMGKEVKDWSGGTDTGGCLRTFNTAYAAAMVDSHTVLIIVSDGWDRGDSELLAREMRRLRQSAYRIIWLNPLCGLPDYEPICKGMQAAMKYIHYLMPAHNLASLEEFARNLPRMCP